MAAVVQPARADDGEVKDVDEARRTAETRKSEMLSRRAQQDAMQSVIDAQRAQLETLEFARAVAAKIGKGPPASPEAAEEASHLEKQVTTQAAVVQDTEEKLKKAQLDLEDAQISLGVAEQEYREALGRSKKDSCGVTYGSSVCLMVGLFAATGSVAAFRLSDQFAGRTSQQLVSFGIPFAGLRIPTTSILAFDIGVLTSVFDTEISLDAQGKESSACRRNGTSFEKRLPCEGNAVIRPYGALFVGPAVGNADLTWISFYLVTGWARTDQDPTANFFIGAMFGALGIQKVLPL